METIEALTRWTARGAFVLYVLALVVRMRVGRQPSADISKPHARRQRAADPLLWTAACALMIAHVGFAFHGFHHWSHRAAYEDTARQTRELLGMNWGGGLYANYALVLVWVADVARRWCRDPALTIQTSALDWCIQVFLAFMWFNATVVFGHGWIRWAGWTGFAILVLQARSFRKNRNRG